MTKDEQTDARERKRALVATVERSLREVYRKRTEGKALLEEALSFVQEDAPMADRRVCLKEQQKWQWKKKSPEETANGTDE